MGDSLKLDKWPEEVEQGGWKWRLKSLPMTDERIILKQWQVWNMYEPIEKLHVPPTMREIMEHLLKGGWARSADYKNADYYCWMNEDGEIYYCLKRHGELPQEAKKHFSGLPRFESAAFQWHLIKSFEWYK